MLKQILLIELAGLVSLTTVPSALAQNGFYGGVSMRENGAESIGLTLGNEPLAWGRFSVSAPTADDTSQRAVLFGGYRWRNDVAVEAVLNTADKYSLQPGRPALSLGPGPGLALSETAARTWNADVYTSWEVIRSVSVYGRLGYAQSEARTPFAGASIIPGDPRRQLQGVNYGLGVRYDMTHSLGLRVEYARFGRFAGEGMGSGLPDSDQVSVGVQFRF